MYLDIVEKVDSKFIVTFYDLTHNLYTGALPECTEFDNFHDAFMLAYNVYEPSADCVLGKATVELVFTVTYDTGEVETISRLVCTTDRFRGTKFEKDIKV